MIRMIRDDNEVYRGILEADKWKNIVLRTHLYLFCNLFFLLFFCSSFLLEIGRGHNTPVIIFTSYIYTKPMCHMKRENVMLVIKKQKEQFTIKDAIFFIILTHNKWKKFASIFYTISDAIILYNSDHARNIIFNISSPLWLNWSPPPPSVTVTSDWNGTHRPMKKKKL